MSGEFVFLVGQGDTSTCYVVRAGKTIAFDDGTSIGAGTEVYAGEVPNVYDNFLRLKQDAPTTPTDQQITDQELGIP